MVLFLMGMCIVMDSPCDSKTVRESKQHIEKKICKLPDISTEEEITNYIKDESKEREQYQGNTLRKLLFFLIFSRLNRMSVPKILTIVVE